jgi:uncharacterized membrane protein
MSTGRMLGSLGLGALVMYLLDPRSGRRRRAVIRDGVNHVVHVERTLLGKATRDLEHRVHGVVEQVKHPPPADVPGEVLVGRVRAAVGRAVSHPAAIEVAAHDCEVTLAGPVLASEARGMLDHVAAVPGVDSVVDRLERHATPGAVPGLQGGRRSQPEVTTMWRPGTRLVLGAAGAAILTGGVLLHRGTIGTIGALAKVAGGALLVRAIANRTFAQVIGIRPLAIEAEKTITIHAPVHRVFALWTRPRIEELPRFLEHVHNVRSIGGGPGRSRWTVDGPLGWRVSFEARITRFEEGRLIAWSTTSGSPLDHTGMVHFEELDGATRVHIQLRYRSPGGLLGHAIARLAGWDPRSRMHDDLVRAKALLEQGRTTAHHHRVELDELAVH